MNRYEIIVTPLAFSHLQSITNYIANTLQAPETAEKWLDRTENAIHSLSTMPLRFRLLDDEPWHSKGVRRMLEGNYYVYYRVEEAVSVVRVLAVLYSRRDQLTQLLRHDIL